MSTLGFSGQRGSKNPVHGAISALRTGDPLEVRESGGARLLADANGQVVGQLARNYRPPSDRCKARVHAIIGWDRRDGTATQQDRALQESWEVVVPELIYELRGDRQIGSSRQGRGADEQCGAVVGLSSTDPFSASPCVRGQGHPARGNVGVARLADVAATHPLSEAARGSTMAR